LSFVGGRRESGYISNRDPIVLPLIEKRKKRNESLKLPERGKGKRGRGKKKGLVFHLVFFLGWGGKRAKKIAGGRGGDV